MIEGTRSGTRLIGSVVRAANDTAPLIIDVNIFDRVGPDQQKSLTKTF